MYRGVSFVSRFGQFPFFNSRINITNPKGITMPKLNTLQDVYIDALRDLYNAEAQITKALPRVMKSVTNEDLKSALEAHLEETEGHIERLEQVFEMAGSKVRGKKCVAMEGIIEEGKEL